MSVKFYKEIINNYEKLYETKEYYDMIIYAGEKPNIKEFHVHSFVLRTQSEFFKKAFITKNIFEKKDDYFILNTNHSSKLLEFILRYNNLFLMYCLKLKSLFYIIFYFT